MLHMAVNVEHLDALLAAFGAFLRLLQQLLASGIGILEYNQTKTTGKSKPPGRTLLCRSCVFSESNSSSKRDAFKHEHQRSGGEDGPHRTHGAVHITRQTLQSTHHTKHVTHHTSHTTRHTSHVIRHTSHVTHHTSHITHHTSHITAGRAHITAVCTLNRTFATASRSKLTSLRCFVRSSSKASCSDCNYAKIDEKSFIFGWNVTAA